MTQIDYDHLGKEFGAQRRQCHSISQKLLESLSKRSTDDIDACKHFRTTTMTSLMALIAATENPLTYFTGDMFTHAVNAAREANDGIPAKRAEAFARKVLHELFRDVVTGVLVIQFEAMGDWRNVGLLFDDDIGTLFVRIYDYRNGEVLARTTPVAYYDDTHMLPAEDSDWFWRSRLSVQAHLPFSTPFSVADVDLASSPDTTRGLATLSVRRELVSLRSAYEAAIKHGKLGNSSDDIEKLRLQVDLSYRSCLPLNRLINQTLDDFKAALRGDNVLPTAQSLIAWCEQYLTEAERVGAAQRAVLKASGYCVAIPHTVPGVVGTFIADTFTAEEVRRSLQTYVSTALEAGNTAKQLQTVESDVTKVLPELTEFLEEHMRLPVADRLRKLLDHFAPPTAPVVAE